MSDIDQLIQGLFQKDQRSLAKLISYIENNPQNNLEVLAKISKQAKPALKIGITGPPGAGKSTLTNQIIKHYRKSGKSVAVLAVDPSSPFTGGAILGDRIRMQDHNQDFDVFMRSLGSRGAQGGISHAAQSVLTLYQAFGFDVVLVETVGVGQTEVDIMDIVDVTAVVLVPESGDTIQTMKAGLMEIADVFVVNKSDREGAGQIFTELKALADVGEDDIPVYKTVATKGEGVAELCEFMAQPEAKAAWGDRQATQLCKQAFDLASESVWKEFISSSEFESLKSSVTSKNQLYDLSLKLKKRFFNDS